MMLTLLTGSSPLSGDAAEASRFATALAICPTRSLSLPSLAASRCATALARPRASRLANTRCAGALASRRLKPLARIAAEAFVGARLRINALATRLASARWAREAMKRVAGLEAAYRRVDPLEASDRAPNRVATALARRDAVTRDGALASSRTGALAECLVEAEVRSRAARALARAEA